MRQRRCSKAIAKICGGAEYPQLRGMARFFQRSDGVIVEIEIHGLPKTETSFFAFHIHDGGSCKGVDFPDAGSHFNPDNTDHAGPGDAVRHAGDLGNITADSDGKAHYNQVDSLISFTGKHNIIGRSVIIHVGEDDLVSQPTGDAGGRVAKGVIGVVQ